MDEDQETEERVKKNLDVLRDAMDYYHEYYWPFYRSYGFSIAEGWAAYKSDMNWGSDDESERWKG